MPLTVRNILGIVAPTVMHDMRRDYVLQPIRVQAENQIFVTALYHRATDSQVSIAWTINDDIRGSEAQRIDMAKALLRNAVESLDAFIREGNNRDPRAVFPAYGEAYVEPPVDEGEDVVNDLLEA